MIARQVRTTPGSDHQPKAAAPTSIPANPLSFWSWVPTASVREKELDLSARRSHNARVVAARRKKGYIEQKQPKDYLQSSEPTDFTSRPLAPPALLKGNSDPFDSFTIHVSPHVTRMVRFARDSYYPSQTLTPWRRLNIHRRQHEGLHFFEIGWSSADCTIAHLASYGAALVRILPPDARRQLEQTWLEVRSLALRRLRNSLAMHSSIGPFSVGLMQQCLYLYKCDVEARIFTSAKIHGTMLRQLLQRTPLNSTTICLFLSVMGNVLQFVCFQLEAPVMTYDDWHPQMWRNIWAKAENILVTRSPHLMPGLHGDIKSPYLREVLSRFRIYLATPNFGPDPSTPQGKTQLNIISMWPVTRIVDDTVKLFAHFQTLRDQYRGQFDNGHVSPTDLWEALLTLSTLCTIRHYLNSPHLDDSNIDLHDASSSLAPLLRSILVNYLRSTSEHDLEQHAEVLFWVYFTGALYEQRSGEYRQQMLKWEFQMQTVAFSARRSTMGIKDSSAATSSTCISRSPNVSTTLKTSTRPDTSLDTNTEKSTSPNTSTPTYVEADTNHDTPVSKPNLTPSTNSKSTNNSNVDESTPFYFTKNLARQAQRLQLQRWGEARDVLARVAYCDELLEVRVEEWWEEIFS